MSIETGSGQTTATSAAATSDVDPKSGAGTADQQQSFTQEQVEQLLKDRLAKAERKYTKRLAEVEALNAGKELKPETKVDKQVDVAEYRQKLTASDAKIKALSAKLQKQQQDALKVKVQQKLMELDCLDPDIAFNDLVSRGMVKMDDDDELVVPELYDSLDSLCKDYLGKKEYLVRAKRQGGAGTKAPVTSAEIGTEKDQILAKIRAVQPNNGLPFGQKK